MTGGVPQDDVYQGGHIGNGHLSVVIDVAFYMGFVSLSVDLWLENRAGRGFVAAEETTVRSEHNDVATMVAQELDGRYAF